MPPPVDAVIVDRTSVDRLAASARSGLFVLGALQLVLSGGWCVSGMILVETGNKFARGYSYWEWISAGIFGVPAIVLLICAAKTDRAKLWPPITATVILVLELGVFALLAVIGVAGGDAAMTAAGAIMLLVSILLVVRMIKLVRAISA